jgi:hypothetical protein
LATILRMDKRTIYYSYRPRQSPVLESALKPQSKDSKMACRPTRVRLRNPTCSWENEHTRRHAVTTTWSRSRRER